MEYSQVNVPCSTTNSFIQEQESPYNLPNELIFLILSFTNSEDRTSLLANRRFYQIGWELKDPTKMLSHACKSHNLELVNKILKHKKINPTAIAKDNYPIQWASEFGHVEVVKELLKHAVDPSANNNFAIRLASSNGHVEVVKELLKDKRVNPAANNNFAIQRASEQGHAEVVKELLKDKRVYPAANNNFAIKGASKSGHEEVVKLLQEYERDNSTISP